MIPALQPMTRRRSNVADGESSEDAGSRRQAENVVGPCDQGVTITAKYVDEVVVKDAGAVCGMERNISRGFDLFPRLSFNVEDENDVAWEGIAILPPSPDENFSSNWMGDEGFTDRPSIRRRPFFFFFDWRRWNQAATHNLT